MRDAQSLDKIVDLQIEILELRSLLNRSNCRDHGIKVVVGCEWCDAVAKVFEGK